MKPLPRMGPPGWPTRWGLVGLTGRLPGLTTGAPPPIPLAVARCAALASSPLNACYSGAPQFGCPSMG
eukprot:15471026-Alexandrium_andersonii.AAC.1